MDKKQRMQELAGLVNESIADDDTKAAKAMSPKIATMIDDIEDMFKDIDKRLSDFGSPGLRSAVADGIRAGLDRQGFNAKRAHSVIEKYFKGR